MFDKEKPVSIETGLKNNEFLLGDCQAIEHAWLNNER